MLRRVASWGMIASGLATDAPPNWAFTQFVLFAGIIALYVVAAIIFTVSLAVVQFRSGPWWAVVGGLCCLAAGAGLLLVAGTSAIGPFACLGVAAYMVATNVVGLRARQLNPVTAGVGPASTVLLFVATPAAGLVGGSCWRWH